MLSPTHHDASSPVVADTSPDFSLLSQLTRPGAVLRLTPLGPRLTTGIGDGEDGAATTAIADTAIVVAVEFVTAALAEGYIEADVRGETYHLTNHGRTSVRRHKALAAAAAATSLPRLANPHSGGRVPAVEAPGFNPAESPLAWLRRRVDRDGNPMITQAQFEAGERLRSDLWLAGLTPRTTQTWSDTPSSRRTARATPGGSAAMTDTLVAARQRVNRAMDAVGPEFGNLLLDVCGFLIGLEAIEASHSWPQRSAKLMLQTALTALARHYGLLPAVDGDRLLRNRLRHWGADDYRPTLDRWK